MLELKDDVAEVALALIIRVLNLELLRVGALRKQDHARIEQAQVLSLHYLVLSLP